MEKIAYLIIRVGIGMSMFGHGLVRLPQLNSWKEGMMEDFEGSILPEFLVTPFFYILPFLEFLIGIAMLLGLFTRNAAIVGGFLMGVLIFGTCIAENYSSIPSQMIHMLLFVCVIQFLPANSFAIDNIINKG
ncbi:DoxX family protein [Pleomorphovibrio marinus]|uniref:DoxX family protein n=1 Tax=Pleomorphovibrio marinus TaxID=2164132 RepID=UPI000E09EB81|nr:DoxX family protein [Pleomorphovibrio marinus]